MVQTDDILEESQLGDGHLSFGTKSRQLANMAIGLHEVFVLQSAASNLVQMRERIERGLAYAGPALFSVFSGATGTAADLPPYLIAAAAMESRAFPAFTFDPSAGTDWASRFDLSTNPQIERDWPLHDFTYETAEHQRGGEEVAFTLVHFVACDRRYMRHFARVPRTDWNAKMVPVGESLAREQKGLPETIPTLLMVDAANVVQKALVDDKVMREARRCRDMWHSLQELGGVNNSHAERLLARERKAQDEREKAIAEARGVEPAPQPGAAAAAPAAAAPAAEAAPEPSPDEAYIETARCTTCNECTKINDKMFAYNDNKQAYIKNPDAGTYAQLVEAAESCQVSIIHPGKPRNPDEPGVAELTCSGPKRSGRMARFPGRIVNDEKIKVRATESGQVLEVVVLTKRADRIEVVLGAGVHSVRCELTPTRTGAAYVGSAMGREIVYERSREQVAADIARLDPALRNTRWR